MVPFRVLYSICRIFDAVQCPKSAMDGCQTLVWWISTVTTQRCSGEGAELHWMKSSTSTIWSTVQMVFVSVIAGSEWMRIPEHHVESPTDASISAVLLKFKQLDVPSADSCLHFFNFFSYSSFTFHYPASHCTTAQIILGRLLKLSHWNITVHSTNRPGSVIYIHIFIICQSNCS